MTTRSMKAVRRALVMVTGCATLSILAGACGSNGGTNPSNSRNDGGADVVIVSDPRPDPAMSSIHADPSTLTADGTTATKLTVLLKRSDGTAVAPTPIALTSSGKGNTFTPAQGVTDAQGIFTATMASTHPEQKKVSASFSGGSLDIEVDFQLCHGPLFLPAATRTASARPSTIVSGDFNGDNQVDLAIGDSSGNDLTILLGDGKGGFSVAPKSNIVPGDGWMTSGDFDGNGTLDLAVANSAGTIVILLGKGDGSFTAAASSPNVGTQPDKPVAADFNGDNKLDLAISDISAKTVSILLGNGDGTFTAANPPTVAVGTTPVNLATSDFNGDKKLDLAVVNLGDNNVSILLGNGNGTFSPARTPTVPVGNNPSAIVSADFNRDGKSDLAVSNNSDATMSILLGNGDGSFTAAHSPGAGSLPGDVRLGDFNADGRLDLVTTNYDTRSVSVLLSNGDGTFQPALSYGAGASPNALDTGDFNGDGAADLAVVNIEDNNLSILLRSGCVLP